jgi:hypothetical protein
VGLPKGEMEDKSKTRWQRIRQSEGFGGRASLDIREVASRCSFRAVSAYLNLVRLEAFLALNSGPHRYFTNEPEILSL